MKTSAIIRLVILFVFASIITVSAKTSGNDLSTAAKEKEQNLIKDLSTNSLDTRVTSVLSLGDMKSSKAMIPLLKILHDEKKDELRIVAALSLIKIGNAIGVYQVKQAARFDKSERVRRMCSIFYNAYANGKV